MGQSIPQDFIDELVNRTDIISLIGERVTLKKAGSHFVGLCPFHQEKTPSFSVSQSKQFYHCYGCGANGNAISFLMQYDSLDFVSTIETLAESLGLSLPTQQRDTKILAQSKSQFELLQVAADFYYQQLSLPENEHAIKYLKSRGLTGKIAKQFQLGYAPAGWDNLLKALSRDHSASDLEKVGLALPGKNNHHYDRFRDRIMFPIRDRRGRTIAFGGRVLNPEDSPKYLNSPETPLFHKGLEVYGLHEVLSQKNKFNELIIVEGYMDVLALAQHGVANVVATLGTSTSKEHMIKLMRIFPKILFCFDGDNAGKQAAWRALKNTLPVLKDEWEIRFMFLPQGEDPDSVIRRLGPSLFEQFIHDAVSIDDFFFSSLQTDLDIHSIGGKAKLKADAIPLIESLPDGVYKQMLFEQLARLLRINSSNLQQLAKTPVRKTAQQASKGPRGQQAHSPLKIALILLLQNPELASELEIATVSAQLSPFNLPGLDVFLDLMRLLAEKPTLTTGGIIEHWRDKPYIGRLSQLASLAHLVPVDGIKAEFNGAIQRLVEQSIEQKLNNLIAKAESTELSREEKINLTELLKQQSRLKEKID